MPSPILLATDAPAPLVPEITRACGERPGTLCRTVYELTNSTYLANGAEVLFAVPFRIAVILIVAFVVRGILHRVIGRMVKGAAEGDFGLLLRPLRGRAPQRWIEAVEVPPAVRERRRQRAETIGALLRSGVSFFVFGTAFLTILGELGINLTPVLASATVIGLSVGFGAQYLVRDFLTGIFLILEDQYGVGDVVDLGSTTGTVEAVGLRTTRLRDTSGTVWHIRNGEILRVGNTSQGWARAVVDVLLPYDCEVGPALDLLQRSCAEVAALEKYADAVLGAPEVWGVEAMDDKGITLRAVLPVASREQWAVARAVRERFRRHVDDGLLPCAAGARGDADVGEAAGQHADQAAQQAAGGAH